MSAPPSAGAVQLAVICWLSRVSVGASGLPGLYAGDSDVVDDHAPSPSRLVAATRTWYDTPLVSPVSEVVVPVPVSVEIVQLLAVSQLAEQRPTL